jgi:ammonia channel protein AmtB
MAATRGSVDSARRCSPVSGPDATIATFSAHVRIPELAYVAFQGAFAAISCALVVGAIAERAKFAAVLLFAAIWFTFAYLPLAHMVWAGNGYLFGVGALDFAGGTVVHINAGVAGLVGAYMLGPRIGFGRERLSPHNLPLTFVGASLLWVGWFGFNAGSALEANGVAALAFVNTLFAAAAAVLAWSAVEATLRGRASMLGAASGCGRRASSRSRRRVDGWRRRRVGDRRVRRRGGLLGRECIEAATCARTTRSTCSASTASAASSARC